MMFRDWVVADDEISPKAYAMIDETNENWVRLYAAHPQLPKEKNMSIETVMENRKKIDQICARLRAREATMTRSVEDGQA
jgi:hypothetical protein